MGVTNINKYISQYPRATQAILQKIRDDIKKLSPKIQETMTYGIPTFKYKGKNLVHFAAYENHIGFYPSPSGILAFKDKLANYKFAKGSVQFPFNKPTPYKLIIEITKFRLSETDSTA